MLLGEIASGKHPLKERERKQFESVTVSDAFEAFKLARKSLRPNTVRDYQQFIDKAFARWASLPMASITRTMVIKRHRYLGDHHGPYYANHACRFLRALYNFAMAQYTDPDGTPVLTHNPIAVLTQTKAWYSEQRRRTFIKSHQLGAWYTAVNALRDDDKFPRGGVIADYLTLLLFTGLRCSEATRLRWEAVDLVDQTMLIEVTKNGEPLTLPLSNFLVQLFERRLSAAENAFVFPGTGVDGHLVEPRSGMRRVTELSGVAFALHDLRRTFITVAESLDVSPYAIKRLVNHKLSSDVTAGYIGNDTARLRRAMQTISDALLRRIAGESADVIRLDSRRPSKRPGT
jgi:integrase